MNRKEIISFYNNTEYKKISSSVSMIAPRPSEWNVPLFIRRIYKSNSEIFKNNFKNGEIVINLEESELEYFKSILLHESMFNFYKAYYNYLCSLKLYDGGLLHWIKITSYYSKFFLAQSIVTLTGKPRYIVTGNDHNFIPDLYELIKSKKSKLKYVIELDINPELNYGKLKITKNEGGGGNHGYIWNKYSKINSNDLNLTTLTYEEISEYFKASHLSHDRNIENYSFNGYSQLDFNVDMNVFPQYFERYYIKKQSNMIYTTETFDVLIVIGELYNLFIEFGIKDLPISKEKLIYISKYSLGDNNQYKKLQDLITKEFPKYNDYLDEYWNYKEFS